LELKTNVGNNSFFYCYKALFSREAEIKSEITCLFQIEFLKNMREASIPDYFFRNIQFSIQVVLVINRLWDYVFFLNPDLSAKI